MTSTKPTRGQAVVITAVRNRAVVSEENHSQSSTVKLTAQPFTALLLYRVEARREVWQETVHRTHTHARYTHPKEFRPFNVQNKIVGKHKQLGECLKTLFQSFFLLQLDYNDKKKRRFAMKLSFVFLPPSGDF